MENVEQYVRFGEDDVPNKYGDTRKMLAIMKIVEDEQDPDDADFEWTEEDLMYYWYNQENYLETKKAHGGKKPVIVHYIND